MTRVEVRNGDLNGAFNRLKRKVNNHGIPSEVKKNRYYEKPGEIRRKNKKKAKKEARKINKRNNRD